MTNKELKHCCSLIRNWLITLGHTMPPQFVEQVAIVTGELTQRLKAEEKEKADDRPC